MKRACWDPCSSELQDISRDKEKRAPRQPHDRVEPERKKVGTLDAVLISEPSRPALCETISAVDGSGRVRLERDLGGLATFRAHRVVHLARASVVAASSAASLFVHLLPTIRSPTGAGCLAHR